MHFCAGWLKKVVAEQLRVRLELVKFLLLTIIKQITAESVGCSHYISIKIRRSLSLMPFYDLVLSHSFSFVSITFADWPPFDGIVEY